MAIIILMTLLGCSKKDSTNPGAEGSPEGGAPVSDTAPPVDSSLPAQLVTPKSGDTIAVFETSLGSFSAVFFADGAPLAVENFVKHAKDGYYNKLLFHRVVSGFVIQTGDPTGTGRGGESIWGDPFANEYSPQLHHYSGAIGMANTAADQNGSQFYFVLGSKLSDDSLAEMKSLGFADDVCAAYKKVGGQPGLDNKYTVFGQVYEGMDIVEKIGTVKADSGDRPKKDVELISVTVKTY